jgi:hypothetical protein
VHGYLIYLLHSDKEVKPSVMHLALQSDGTATGRVKGEGSSAATGHGKGTTLSAATLLGKGTNTKDPVPPPTKKGPLSSAKRVKRSAMKGDEECAAAMCSGKKG